MRGFMGGLYRLSEWIMRFSVTNLLWLICSLPFGILFIGPLLAASTKGIAVDTSNGPLHVVMQLLALFAPAMILAPFTLFPATSAMYTLARKWVTGDEDAPLFKTFFNGFRSNYKQSMFGGFFFVVVTVMLAMNYGFYTGKHGFLQLFSFLFLVFIFITVAAFFHFFSIVAHFHMSFWQVIKNAFLFAIGRPFTSILLIITNFFIVYISLTKISFLIPFFMGSGIAYISFWYFYRLFVKIQAKLDQQKEQGQGERQDIENTEDVSEADEIDNSQFRKY